MFALKRSSPQVLLREIEKEEPIVYTNNGNRSSDASEILRRVEPLLPFVGITRVSNISQLAANSFPVYQSVRPHVYFHTRIGQNSGAQGKGSTHEQAKISCLMETMEGFCMEPRELHLIRGSYDTLKKNHVICPPEWFLNQYGVKPARRSEPLMWTPASSLELKHPVLVPAEAVFLPFHAPDFQTRTIYASRSTGVAAGATYLEAIIHGLYEHIERHYCAVHEEGKAKAEALFDDEIESEDIRRFKETLGGEFELRIFTLRIPRIRNLPMIKCLLVGQSQVYSGFGCCAHVDMAIYRAVSEALQAYAVTASGSREDIIATRVSPRKKQPVFKGKFPNFRTLSLNDYKKQVFHRMFTGLKEELRFIKKWLYSLGHKNILVADLTFEGMPLAIVRTLVPGLKDELYYRSSSHITSRLIQDLRYYLK